jgi:hypothetical protein
MASDRAWVSPVGMLVQAEAGLMVSYRGALEFNWHIETPDAPPLPLHRMRQALHHRLPSGRATGRSIRC